MSESDENFAGMMTTQLFARLSALAAENASLTSRIMVLESEMARARGEIKGMTDGLRINQHISPSNGDVALSSAQGEGKEGGNG